jgi:hypothetical protein
MPPILHRGWDTRNEQMYASVMAGRLTVEDIATIRRAAAMAPLTAEQVRSLLDGAEELARDRAQLEELTSQLRGPFSDVRRALNELAKLAAATRAE